MTCKEKLKAQHPEYSDDVINYILKEECPTDQFLMISDPAYCNPYSEACEKCWNREIPETASVYEICQGIVNNPDAKKVTVEFPDEPPTSDKYYNPIQKAYDLMVGFCHGNKTTDLEEVIGYLGEALDEHPEDSIEEVACMNPEHVAMPHIKDSGDRTQFESGAVRDMREGKGRCDLMPLEVAARVFSDPVLVPSGYNSNLSDIRKFQETNKTCYLYYVLRRFAQEAFDDFETMLLEVAKHFEEGAKKYGESNWQKGIPTKCYIDSAVRHYLKWMRGDKDEPHDRAFVWNLMCCIWEVDYHKKEDEE